MSRVITTDYDPRSDLESVAGRACYLTLAFRVLHFAVLLTGLLMQIIGNLGAGFVDHFYESTTESC